MLKCNDDKQGNAYSFMVWDDNDLFAHSIQGRGKDKAEALKLYIINYNTTILFANDVLNANIMDGVDGIEDVKGDIDFYNIVCRGVNAKC